MPIQFRIYEYNNPHFQVYKKHGKFPSNLTFGFENEITYRPYNSAKLDDKIEKFILTNPYLYMKDESSCNGVEVNSHPMNFNFFTTLMKDYSKHNFISELSALTTPHKFYINPNCGFHMHLGRKYFSKKHLVKMVKFFYDPKHTKFLFKISKRSKNGFNTWASTYIPKHEVWMSDKEIPYTFKQIASWGSYRFDNKMGEKSCILNLYPKKTVEIRMFKGTTNPVLFRSYLEFALAVSLFTKDTNYDEVNIKNFKKFVKNNIKTYKNLDRLIMKPRSLRI